MFNWLRGFRTWLGSFIVSTPGYVAAPAMLLIGALDSSLLSLPEINDYLVVTRCYLHPPALIYFPLFAATGSVIGSLLLYTILRRGGQAVLHRRFRVEHIQRVENAYARFGILALAVPALWPPPMPFKIFVATAGALQYPRRRFILTILIARSLRYYVEGALAIVYGRRVLRFMEDNGPLVISAFMGVLLVALAVYLFTGRGRAAVKKGKEAASSEDQ
jgi:membrane protein YqaA with SNARE-associated domain